MGLEGLKALLAKIDTNLNNIIEQSEIDAFKKANPTVPLNGVEAGMFAGNPMDGIQIEKTSETTGAGTASALPQDNKEPVFKKADYFEYKDNESPYNKVNDLKELFVNDDGKKDATYQDIRGLNLTKEDMAKIYVHPEMTLISDEQLKIYKELHPDFEYAPYNPVQIKKAGSLAEIPKGSHDDIKDARQCDITALNLTKEQLLNLCIDDSTVMTDEQKKIVDEAKEKMKSPGLGINELHKQGFTGKGITIAIIDQPLGEHKEYAQNLVHLEDVNTDDFPLWKRASMHGSAVASIAVGKTTGVAPDSDLAYYTAVNRTEDPAKTALYEKKLLEETEQNKDNPKALASLQEKYDAMKQTGSIPDNTPYADAINRILDKNKELPDGQKIPVISISWGFDPPAPGYDKLTQAVERAKKEGVFVVSTALDRQYGMQTCGANRDPQADPDNPDSYEAGAFWKKVSEDKNSDMQQIKDSLLLVPMDHRTIADFKSKDGYRFEGNDGGMSRSTPWIAGMYALAKQVDPSVTPQQFWQKALETSDECRNNDTNTYVGRLINPQKLIESFKK